jgi:methionyl-tRNA formyltransferase
MIDVTIEMVLEFFKALEVDKITYTEQDESQASYACKRVPEDGKINWHDKSQNIYNLIRALAYPYQGAFCHFEKNGYIIRRARIGDDNKKKYSGSIPGRVIKIKADGIEILCGEGSLFISEWENMTDGRVSSPSEEIKSISSTLL